jgi:hypothetical protein
MKLTYQEIIDPIFKTKVIKATNSDGVEFWIPTDEGNSDYQRYLRWLENPEAEQSTQMVTDEAATL